MILALAGCVKTIKVKCASAPLPSAPTIVREYEKQIESVEEDFRLREPTPLEVLDMLEYIQLLKDGYGE